MVQHGIPALRIMSASLQGMCIVTVESKNMQTRTHNLSIEFEEFTRLELKSYLRPLEWIVVARDEVHVGMGHRVMS
jgi:hypothetical protein